MCRLDGVDSGAAEVLVERLKIGLFAEDDVGGVFALIHAPVIFHAEGAMDGAETTGESVQPAVQALDLQLVGDLLGPCPVADIDEGVVLKCEVDAAFAQPGPQPVVAVGNRFADGRAARWARARSTGPVLRR